MIYSVMHHSENWILLKGLTKALRDLLEDLKANAVGLSMYDLFGYKSTLQEIQENIEFIIKGSCTEEPYAATVWRSDPITPLVRSAECILAIFEDGVRPDFVRWNYEKEMWVDPYNSSIEYRKKDPWKWAEIIISLSPKAINRRPFCLSGYYI